MTDKPTAEADRDLLELTTDSELASSGAAVSRAPDGRIVFVRGAAPNEKVMAAVVREKKSFLEAEVREVIEPSAERVEPRCEHFLRCGGCVTQHVSRDSQVRSKQRAFTDALSRVGRIDLSTVTVDEPWSGSEYEYRTRARLAITRDGRIGYRARRGRDIIQVRRCPILDPVLSRALEEEQQTPGPRVSGELRLLAAGGRALVSRPKQDSESVLEDDGFGPRWISADVFSQGNAAGNTALLDHVRSLLDGQRWPRAVELFAGSGNLTRLLVDVADEVVAIEGNKSAVVLGQKTLPHVDWRPGDVERTLERLGGDAKGLFVLDPPRVGAPEAAIAVMGEWADAVLYVSCNPATFARDAGRLAEAGLRLRRARLFDFYPQTEHAEVVGWFERSE